MNTTTTTKNVMSEDRARSILGETNYNIYYQYYSIGRLSVAAALAADENPRRAAALRSIIQRRQQEGRP